MPDPDLLIRAIEPSDIPPLTALANLPGVRHGTLRLPFTNEAYIRGWIDPPKPDSHHIVGLMGEQLVAHGGLFRFSGRESHCADVMLVVHDAYCGRGIGRRMLSALLDLADNWLGLTRVQLGVNSDNVPAIRLYESMGFEHEGTQRAATLRDGILVDVHMMARLRAAPRRAT